MGLRLPESVQTIFLAQIWETSRWALQPKEGLRIWWRKTLLVPPPSWGVPQEVPKPWKAAWQCSILLAAPQHPPLSAEAQCQIVLEQCWDSLLAGCHKHALHVCDIQCQSYTHTTIARTHRNKLLMWCCTHGNAAVTQQKRVLWNCPATFCISSADFITTTSKLS